MDSSSEIDSRLQRYWLQLSLEQRFQIIDGLYVAEKTLLERLAPQNFTKKDVGEFVYFHMHGEKWPDWARDNEQ